jgi:hypothetical protein
MGIYFFARRLSVQQWHRLVGDPDLAGPLIYGKEVPGVAAAPPELALDLDKAWHGLHYLLASAKWQVSDGAGSAVLGGQPIGEDNGYGPARVLEPDLVREVSVGLAAIDVDRLRARFDPEAMTELDIYPGPWRDPADFDRFLAPRFIGLCDFYRDAAAAGDAVLLGLT